MAKWKGYLILLLFIKWFCQCSTQGSEAIKDHIYEVVRNDWKLVEKGWPLEDIEDSFNVKRTQFFYNERSDWKKFTFKVKESFLQEAKKNTGYFKISFKIWFYSNSSRIIVKHDGSQDSISDRYKSEEYENQWMLCEYVENYESLKSFGLMLDLNDIDTKIALKDLKIEYESPSLSPKKEPFEETIPQNNKNIKNPILNHWNIYISPPKEDATEVYNFMFFSMNCNNGCSISTSGLKFPDQRKKDITDVVVKFKYWLKGTKEIKINGQELKLNDTWNENEIHVPKEEFLKFSLNIKTANTEFVAIRDLKMIVKTNGNETHEFPCSNFEKCKWSGNLESYWSKSDNFSDSSIYYYPTIENNSITILRSDNLRENDVCFRIGYCVTKHKSTKIKVYYKNLNEPSSELILTLKPKVFQEAQVEETKFCMRDIIALNVRDYSISFVVDQPNMKGLANDFLLRLDEVDSKQSTWNFSDSSQNFLLSMKSSLDPTSKWNDEWMQLTPEYPKIFDLDREDFVLFQATSESEIPASAVLMSKNWIVNSKELRSKNSSYSVKVKKFQNFRNFRIVPRICDWLSQCYDVNQKKVGEENELTMRTFDFNFLDLSYSSHIKLSFYVEYFKISTDLAPVPIEFNLTLKHFGDPCSNNNACKEPDICISDPKSGIPNKIVCSCDGDCSTNNCRKRSKDKHQSGDLICSMQKLDCVNWNNDFKCLCNSSHGINWNRNSTSCEPPSKDSESFNWGLTGEFLQPTAVDNMLEYSLIEIENEQFDVCVDVTYSCNGTTNLEILYSEDNANLTLFSIFLSPDATNFKFCVRDFLYEFKPNFKLALKVLNYTKEDSFKILRPKFSVNKMTQKSSIYINDESEWRIIPDVFTPGTKNFSINLKVGGKNHSMSAYIISDWINTNSQFNIKDNIFTVENHLKSSNRYILKQRILTFTNETTEKIKITEPYQLAIVSTNSEKNETMYRISKLDTINVPFKVIIEVTHEIREEEMSQENSILFRGFSIGDPCFVLNSKNEKSTFCGGEQYCHPIPGNPRYECKCPEGKTGPNCDITNNCKNATIAEETCRNSPSLPFDVCEIRPDKTLGCKCLGNYKWNNQLKRCVKIWVSPQHKSCESTKCDFIDSITKDMIWSNKNIITTSENLRVEGEIFVPTDNKSQYIIQVSNIDQNETACFNLSYSLSENAHLDIYIDEVKSLTLGSTQLEKLNDFSMINGFANENFCVNDLYKKVTGKFNITFMPNINNTSFYTIALKFNNKKEKVSLKTLDDKYLYPLPFLTHWSSNNGDLANNITFKVENQWPLKHPGDTYTWKPNSDDEIKFESQGQNFVKREAILISNWLKKEISARDFRFNISSCFEDFLLKFVVFDDKMQEIPASNIVVGDERMDPNALNDFTVAFQTPKMKTSFKVALKVEYRSGSKFSLKSIDLGDPCIDSFLNYRECNQGIGKCERNLDQNDYKCNCKETSYTGKDCTVREYCDHKLPDDIDNTKTGSEFCEERMNSSCQNSEGSKLGFKCICSNETYWHVDLENKQNSNCLIIPKCIEHKCNTTTQICKTPENVKENYKCECNKENNYYNVSDKCEKFDPCSESLRNARNLDFIKPCGDSNATCVSLGDGPEDYMCVCPKGFKNTDDKFRENTKCEPLFCNFPSLNECDQICDPTPGDGKEYTCKCKEFYDLKDNKCNLRKDKQCSCPNGAFCLENGKCDCKQGYVMEDDKGKVVGCKPDPSFHNEICPYGNTTNTNKNELACFCGDAFEKNDKNTCDFKPICSKGSRGRTDCDAKNALCIIDFDSLGEWKCRCPIGKASNSTGAQDIGKHENSICVDKCLINNRAIDCLSMNAVCDPLEIKDTQSNPSEFCICNPGYVKMNGTCKLGKYSREFSISFKNTFSDSENQRTVIDNTLKKTTLSLFSTDASKLAADLQSSNEENLKIEKAASVFLSNFKINKFLMSRAQYILSMIQGSKFANRVSLEKWDLINNFYECKFVITSDKKIDNASFTKSFSENCQPLPEQPDLCFFSIRQQSIKYFDDSKDNNEFILVNKSKVYSTEYEPCSKSRITKSCPDYSRCVPDKDTSLYSCLCSPKYFSVSAETLIELENGGQNDPKHVKQSCKVLDNLCDICPSKNGICSQTAPRIDKSGNWIAEPLCTCADTFILSNNSKECIDVCVNRNCNHGTCKPKGASGFACECSDGWNGENCDKEYKTSLGGWIAGIVVLAVLVVIVGGVAIIFARRARNSDHSGIHSSHQMDDYTGSSYRVGQHGQAASRGQPTYPGRDNQAFHRD